MNKQQFENLKVGDRCVMKRGRDNGIICEVRYIENDSILVRPVDDSVFRAIGTNKKLRLTGWRELDPYSKSKKSEKES